MGLGACRGEFVNPCCVTFEGAFKGCWNHELQRGKKVRFNRKKRKINPLIKSFDLFSIKLAKNRIKKTAR